MIYYFVLTERMTVLTMLSCMNLNSTLIRLAVGCVYVAVVCINVSDCVCEGPQEECPGAYAGAYGDHFRQMPIFYV